MGDGLCDQRCQQNGPMHWHGRVSSSIVWPQQCIALAILDRPAALWVRRPVRMFAATVRLMSAVAERLEWDFGWNQFCAQADGCRLEIGGSEWVGELNGAWLWFFPIYWWRCPALQCMLSSGRYLINLLQWDQSFRRFTDAVGRLPMPVLHGGCYWDHINAVHWAWFYA